MDKKQCSDGWQKLINADTLSISFSDTGSYSCKVVDSTGNTALSNSAHCQIVDTFVVFTPDDEPPVITRVKPVEDCVTTNSFSYMIFLKCTDVSGVQSVNGTMGSASFTGVPGV